MNAWLVVVSLSIFICYLRAVSSIICLRFNVVNGMCIIVRLDVLTSHYVADALYFMMMWANDYQ